jgi:hypothetical protein
VAVEAAGDGLLVAVVDVLVAEAVDLTMLVVYPLVLLKVLFKF